MTDRETVVHLAEFMGWTVKTNPNTGNTIAVDKEDSSSRVHLFGNIPTLRRWNPLEKWDDVMEVQAKVIADPKLSTQYALRMHDIACGGVAVVGQKRLHLFLLSATPRQRCLAIVEATR